MPHHHSLLSPIAAILACLLSGSTQAQQTTISTPQVGVGSSFFEQTGVGFGGRIGNNVFFNNGGGGARPPWAAGNGGGANFGFGIRGNGFGANFGFSGETGYDANMSSITPSVTVQNGATGAIFSGQQRPFVTGLVPLVGDFSPGVGYTYAQPTYTSPLMERLMRIREAPASATPVAAATKQESPPTRQATSTAERGDLSLSAIRAQQAATGNTVEAEIAAFLEAGRLREAAGEPRQAIIDYQRAAARAKGELKQQIQAKIQELRALK